MLALFPSADGEIALLQKVFELVGSVHILEQFALHFIFRESEVSRVNNHTLLSLLIEVEAYCTRVNMTALGTMSIIVRRVILKYELMSNSVFLLVIALHLGHQGHTDNLHFLTLFFRQSSRGFELWRRGLHRSHLLLVLRCKEAAKEAGAAFISEVEAGTGSAGWYGGRESLAGLRIDLHRLTFIVAIVDNSHCL